MSLVARALEADGIPTVVIGSARDIVEECGVARFLFNDFPLGNPCGVPYDVEMQRAIARHALDLLESARLPRTTVQTPFRFAADESWRERYARVDPEEAERLRRAGEAVPIQPKPLALLAYLVRERERVVPSDELFEALWPGTIVTPASLTRAVSHARRAIGDTHKGRLLRSVARRGYRFEADVLELEPEAAGAPGERATPERPFVGREDALAKLRDAWTRAALASSRNSARSSGPRGARSAAWRRSVVVSTCSRAWASPSTSG